jgi:hypothetical protein
VRGALEADERPDMAHARHEDYHSDDIGAIGRDSGLVQPRLTAFRTVVAGHSTGTEIRRGLGAVPLDALVVFGPRSAMGARGGGRERGP